MIKKFNYIKWTLCSLLDTEYKFQIVYQDFYIRAYILKFDYMEIGVFEHTVFYNGFLTEC